MLPTNTGNETENTEPNYQKNEELLDKAIIELMELQDTLKSGGGGAL